MSQQRIDRSGNQNGPVALASIDSNFDDVFDVVQVLDADFSFLASVTPTQLLNGSPKGALNLPKGLYEFECMFDVVNWTTSSASFGFALGGSATIESQKWFSLARLGSETNPTGPGASYNAAAQPTLIAASTFGIGWTWLRGIFRLSAGGTLIPQISFTAITGGPICTVKKNSFFRAKKLSAIYSAVIIQPPLPRPSPDTPFWS